MLEINRLYSTLERTSNQISIADDENEEKGKGKSGLGNDEGLEGEFDEDDARGEHGGIGRPDKQEDMAAYQDQ